MTGSLADTRVLVTREHPGELAMLLAARGATVVHVPLIRVVEPLDGGTALADQLRRIDSFDWLVVTSPAGAQRVGPAVAAAPLLRLAVVGTATERTLAAAAGRSVDLVASSQRSQALLEELCAAAEPSRRILVAQADRAKRTLVDGLRHAGHDVTAVVAYRTVLQVPDRTAMEHVDAVVFASGSAVEAWNDALGAWLPPIVVSIGPTTTAVAENLGLKITSTAADHSLDGLVTELERIVACHGRDAASANSARVIDVQQSSEIDPTK